MAPETRSVDAPPSRPSRRHRVAPARRGALGAGRHRAGRPRLVLRSSRAPRQRPLLRYHRRMPPVDVERRGAVALLTLNSPPANALGTPVLTALEDAIEALRGDDVRAAVVTGSGRFFSADRKS